MGGAFTDHATWRWCFYVNLPIGGITAVGILVLLKLPPRAMAQKRSRIQTMKSLDPLGTMVFVPSIVCLLLALQWGGLKYSWSNGRIIALFVLFVIGVVIFIGLQIAQGENATGRFDLTVEGAKLTPNSTCSNCQATFDCIRLDLQFLHRCIFLHYGLLYPHMGESATLDLLSL